MARLASQAVGGYFKTPAPLLASIASLVTREPAGEYPGYSLLDPCAGDGEAGLGIARHVFGAEMKQGHFYGIEMEATRHASMVARLKPIADHGHARTLHGDAFNVAWSMTSRYRSGGSEDPKPGMGLLYLNPPYQNGSLEARFLDRFTSAVAPGGVLIYVVPFYALAKSAAILAQHFQDLACFRFPEPYFTGPVGGFRQVVLYAKRRGVSLLEPDAATVAQVIAWSSTAEASPELPRAGSCPPILSVPAHGLWTSGFAEWDVRACDREHLLARFQPWAVTDKAGRQQEIPGIQPHGEDLLRRVYPMAVAAKPAHVSTSIAGGVYNGARVEPDDPTSGLPPLLVKGLFIRDHKVIGEKLDKAGNQTGIIRIQQPKLRVTVLDLMSHCYATLKDDVEESAAITVEGMTVGDLLASYGRDLVRVMGENCPLLHDARDPAHEIQLPSFPRALFRAQRHAVMALVKLLGGVSATAKDRQGKAAMLLGEVGVGKSFIALAVAKTIRARRPLVVCPPHLLAGWVEQVALALPEARAVVVTSIADVDALAADGSPGVIVTILSRNAAKLGHAYAGVSTGRCPTCGEPTPKPSKASLDAVEELARTRATCETKRRTPAGPVAHAALALALALLPIAPHAPEVAQCLSGAHATRMLTSARSKAPAPSAGGGDAQRIETSPAWERARVGEAMRRSILAAVAHLASAKEYDARSAASSLVIAACVACDDPEILADTADRLYRASLTVVDAQTAWGHGANMRSIARAILHLLPPASEAQKIAEARIRAHRHNDASDDVSYVGGSDQNPWRDWESVRDAIAELRAGTWGKDAPSWQTPKLPSIGLGLVIDSRGALRWETAEHGSVALRSVVAGVKLLGMLASIGDWETSPECGTKLYQAIPEPRTYPLAKYITRRHPKLFDLLIADEAHEARNQESAQSQAVRALIRIGLPTIAATGSVMGGYAEDLFAMQWACDPAFREEFGPKDKIAFCNRYGYRKELVETADDGKASKRAARFGAVSDRVEESGVRTIGPAPGVMPLFVLRFLLRISVTIHKEDLDDELPPCREIVEYIDAGDLGKPYATLAKKLGEQIKKDRFDALLAGKLWGAMAELPSFLDRATCDAGNVKEGEHVGEYRICYPNNRDLGSAAGKCLIAIPGLHADTILPKEQWLIDTVRRELAEGRPCVVFSFHRNLLPRYQRLLEQALGERVAVLDADKVAPADRIDWINSNVLGKESIATKRGKQVRTAGKAARVLCVNSFAVQTGINNLVTFPTAVWMENPNADAIAYRQANGRFHRIGQTREVRIYFPVYRATAQEVLHTLLLHKVGVSMATDGLDAASALEAAGVGGGEQGVDGFAVGRLLFEVMAGERTIAARKGRAVPKKKRGGPAAELVTVS